MIERGHLRWCVYHQVFPTATSKSIALRNAFIRKKLEKKFGSMPELLDKALSEEMIPDSFRHYTKMLECTHAGEPRIRHSSSRSAKKRPKQTYRSVGCEAKVGTSTRERAAGLDRVAQSGRRDSFGR
jgi:hypothetical protein